MMNPGEASDEFLDLMDLYCSDFIDDDQLRRLEAILTESEPARRLFVEYFYHHTEIQFAVRAGKAADAILGQLSRESQPLPRISLLRHLPTRGGRLRWILGLAASVLVFATMAGLWGSGRMNGPPIPSSAAGKPAAANIAWLVNAQYCRWAGPEQTPGRDMSRGKMLRLERGLAEIEFERGARVILQGPVGIELVSASCARLLHGTLTARVSEGARGFTILSPHGKVVDLGTEFGLSVDERGSTTVRVFTGEVEAFSFAADRPSTQGVTIHQDETAQIDGPIVALESAGQKDAIEYVRAIVPPPVVRPRSYRLDFTRPTDVGIRDVNGKGTGLTHRLPGTGSALPLFDPNLRLQSDRNALELTTTRSDLNTQERMPTGEYLGFRLADLGFTGKEDFEISATIPSIPGLKVVGQFGLYVGPRSTESIRGGLISRLGPDTYQLFLVNNVKGIDTEIYEVGLMSTGDDIRLTLRRTAGKYSLVADNLTRNSSSTLTIAHPAFLDGERELHVGLFGANTQSDLCKTLTIREVKATVWTTLTDNPTIVQSRSIR
jgi:FecR protein